MKILYRKKLAPSFTPIKYGLFYNFYAVTDARGIAPAGWHVPTSAELQTLGTFVGSTGGWKLREATTDYWQNTYAGANTTGFNGRGAGVRAVNGVYSGFRTGMHVMSRTLDAAPQSCFYMMINNNTIVGSNATYAARSVRLLKDDTTNPGYMLDFDGNVYPTCKIGTQVWMAQNLIVEHYNNGSVIPLVTDNTAWTALSYGALCYPNNDMLNK